MGRKSQSLLEAMVDDDVASAEVQEAADVIRTGDTLSADQIEHLQELARAREMSERTIRGIRQSSKSGALKTLGLASDYFETEQADVPQKKMAVDVSKMTYSQQKVFQRQETWRNDHEQQLTERGEHLDDERKKVGASLAEAFAGRKPKKNRR